MNRFAVFYLILLAPLLSFSQAIQKDKIILEAYHGFPNGWTTFMTMSTYGEENITVTGTGPLGIRAEYMASDKIGIIADVWYVSSGVAFVQHTQVFDSINMVWEDRLYSYKLGRDKLAAIFCFSFHFADSPDFDAYVSIGAGIKKATFYTKTNDPDYSEDNLAGLIPADARLSLNGRYYFNETIGLNFSIGIGGPLLSGGLSIKI